jgi:hypothetical protein
MENFNALGTDLIERSGPLSLDMPSFEKEWEAFPRLLTQYSNIRTLVAKKADKQSELGKFGPLPGSIEKCRRYFG